MDAFSLPLVVFTAFMIGLLVAIFRGAFVDAVPRRSATTWAVTCPLAGPLYGVGLAAPAIVSGAVSLLALGTLAWWFLAPADDTDDEAYEAVDPDPGPRAGALLDRPQQTDAIDWEALDRLRIDWEREPRPAPLPQGV